MVRVVPWLGIPLAALLSASSVTAQTAQPRYSADELTAVLRPGGEVTYTSDQLARILRPRARTRSLVAGEGTDPGTPGSGVVPDLKVLFASNSAQISPGARRQLDALADAMQNDTLRDYSFRIGGHTDAAGSDAYNEQLSRRRASAVVGYLTGTRGVEAERLEAVGYGERELVDPGNPRSGSNRRVEVRTLE